MTDLLKISLPLGAALLAGCVSSLPQNAEEFRKAVPGAFMAKTETIEVARPFREVAANFQKRAPECLDVTIKTTSQTNMSYQVIVTAYKPTVVVTKERAELHVQQDHKTGVLKVHEEPRAGYRYEAEVTYRDDTYHVVIHESRGGTGGGREIDLRRLDTCERG